MDYIVYLLINNMNNYTYIGITNNQERRLRQHNCEIAGGARYTHNFKKDGEWIYYGYINNLTKNIALSLEKRIQKKSRKITGKTPLEKRLNAINFILSDTIYNNLYIFNQIL